MFKEVIETINWNGNDLTIKTGKIARQSTGAVMVSMGDTVVMCTTVSAKSVKEGCNFFPLTVHYREMAFAAGKIPGGFFKREGRGSEKEVLTSRLIDRPIRPLFHQSFFHETQVIATVLSYDERFPSDILAIIGCSAALAISGVPYLEIVAAARVGHIDGELVLNPAVSDMIKSNLDLVVAGTKTSVMMVESQAKELSEKEMLEAVEFGHKSLQPVLKMIESLVKKAGKEKWSMPEPVASEEFIKELSKKYGKDIENAYKIKDKQSRVGALNDVHDAVIGHFVNDDQVTPLQIDIALDDIKAKVLRGQALKTGIRIDGRKLDQIRPIESEVSLLPRAHGSALFTRGETQAFVALTLGTGQDEQMIDGLDGEAKERFMLNYIFPPYSVGEATPLRAPGRREVGHGKLAWRALHAVVPTKSEFPYTIRIVSEITESNGSSSMATVCGTSLAMMDAGVPLKAPVSGIAMGLIMEGKEYAVLSDILGDEDHLGDMDFKVAGTEEGITALQMDIKVTGITIEIMKKALEQAKGGRLHILGKMAESLTAPRGHLNANAPQVESFKIDKDKIREVIGSGGKVIKEICELTTAKIDITDEGMVTVAAVGRENLQAAVDRVKGIAFDPELGQVFEGTVMKVLDAGAFVNYLPGKDGFVHISEIADQRIENIHEHLEEGKKVKIKFIGMDPVKGKAKFSMRIDFDHASLPARDSAPRGDKKPFNKDKPRHDAPRDRDGNRDEKKHDEKKHDEKKHEDRAPRERDDSSTRRRKNDRPAAAEPTSERKYFS